MLHDVVRPAAELQTVVLTNEAVNGEYRCLVLSCGAPATMAQPGQFFQLLCPQIEDPTFLRRPMSVYHASPERNEIQFLYKVTGRGTRGLATLRPGDTANVFGPLGNGFTIDPATRHLAVLGRGVGLATLAPLAIEARRRGVAVTAILSARSAELVMSREIFQEAGVETIAVTDDNGSSAVHEIERLLRRLVIEQGVDAFATCGSNRLMLLMQALSHELGIAGEVALEQQMACGLGMCYCCVRAFRSATGTEHRRVCWDGPVFPIAEAISW